LPLEAVERRLAMVRELDIGTRAHTRVICEDEPSFGGACHEYVVRPVDAGEPADLDTCGRADFFALVRFQKGPVKEHGVNGCHQEDLLGIVIDRLRHFQEGEFRCRENALAITKIEEALHWLNHRTSERQKRGVEGTDQK